MIIDAKVTSRGAIVSISKKWAWEEHVKITDMKKRLSRSVKELLDKSIDSATQAIPTYNDLEVLFELATLQF